MPVIQGFGPLQPSYIHIGHDLPQLLGDFLPEARVFVISEVNVYGLHHQKLPSWPGQKIVLPSLGEGLKTLDWVTTLLNWFYGAKVTRKDTILVFGGGALTDLVNFAASIYSRGIPTVLVPTTLLAQVDAAVGGKCGVNWRGVKNQLGSFYFPQAVFCSQDVLKTLKPRHLYAGLAEVVKYQVLWLGEDWDRFAINLTNLEQAVFNCCHYKNSVVSKDPFDHHGRQQLNLGHTLAHALESLHPKLLHGEAVAWGLEYAIDIAMERKIIGNKALKAVKFLRAMPRPSLPKTNFDDLYRIMKRDKKNPPGMVGLILPRAQGGVEYVGCTKKELKAGWQRLQK